MQNSTDEIKKKEKRATNLIAIITILIGILVSFLLFGLFDFIK